MLRKVEIKKRRAYKTGRKPVENIWCIYDFSYM